MISTTGHTVETKNRYFTWQNDLKHGRSIAVKASYLFLHQFDLALTVFAASIGLHEVNPLMRNLLSLPAQLLVVKFAIPLLIAWLVPSRFLIPAIILLSTIIGWNVKELWPLLF